MVKKINRDKPEKPTKAVKPVVAGKTKSAEKKAVVNVYSQVKNEEVKSVKAQLKVTVKDRDGKEVASFVGNGLTQEINVEALKAGIYTIQIATATGNSSKQFVKK